MQDLEIDYQLPPVPNLTQEQQTFRWFMKPFELLLECQQTLGNAFTLHLHPVGTHVFFSNPDTVAKILKADSVLTYETNDKEFMVPLLGKYSLFLLYGEKHLERRRLLSSPFHASKIQQYGNTIQTLALQACAKMPVNKPISLLEYMFELSLEIIFDIAFGINNRDQDEEIKAVIHSILKINRSGAVFINSSGNAAIEKLKQSFNENKAKLDELLIALIEERKNNPNHSGTDILSLLINCRDENNQNLSSIEIRDHIITALIAGHETTATAIAWAIYWVHANEDVKSKLDNMQINLNDINEVTNNPYLHAVCQETVRIIPIVAIISRTLKIPFECEGYILPKGINISVPVYLLHRNSIIYPEPELFKPERFLNKKYAFNEYLPFGGGARICLGMGLALYQMKIILAVVLSRFDIKLLSDNKHPKVIRKGVVMAPAEGVRVMLSRKD